MSRSKDRALGQLLTGLDIQDNVETGRHGGIPTRTYRSTTLPEARTLMWLHGGAFSHGGLDQLESHAVAAALAQRGITVIAVDYRRVPPWSWRRDSPPGDLAGVRFPIPVEDVVDAYAAVAARIPRVALGGASAGACLAAGATLRMSAEDDLVPPELVLAYGTFHAHLPPISPQLQSRIRGRHSLVQFRPATVRRMNHNYAGSESAMRSPYAFPGEHPLQGMPPTFLIDADRDSLRASGETFATELAAAGVDTEHRVVKGSTHGFLDRPTAAAFHEGIRLIADRLTAVPAERPPQTRTATAQEHMRQDPMKG